MVSKREKWGRNEKKTSLSILSLFLQTPKDLLTCSAIDSSMSFSGGSRLPSCGPPGELLSRLGGGAAPLPWPPSSPPPSPPTLPARPRPAESPPPPGPAAPPPPPPPAAAPAPAAPPAAPPARATSATELDLEEGPKSSWTIWNLPAFLAPRAPAPVPAVPAVPGAGEGAPLSRSLPTLRGGGGGGWWWCCV